MARIKLGDIFEINTPKGKAYLHYVHLDDTKIAMLRVLQGLYQERPMNFDEIASAKERYLVKFPLGAAHYRKIVQRVGFYPADNFIKPQFMRSPETRRGELLGWYIVNTATYHRQLVEKLSPEQKQLSDWAGWNDTLLIERLVSDWSLDKWEFGNL
jgi:hypothetical protein